MQLTLYYNRQDQYLVDLVDEIAERERKSRSAVIMSILEEHFERGKRLGEILVDLKAVTPQDVEEALQEQKKSKSPRKIGEILVEKGRAPSELVKRALVIQGRFNRS